MADGFTELDSYLTSLLARMSPTMRRKVSRKIGMELRKANAKRIADNVQPDGSSMQPRKPRRLMAGRGAIKKGKMFRKLRLARSFKVRPSVDGVSVGFEGAVARTARAHQYGLTDFVGRTETGRTVRTKYSERVLLGFGSEALEMIADTVMDMLEE